MYKENAHSWQELLCCIDACSLQWGNPKDIWFRGQNNYDNELLPRLFRFENGENKELRLYELFKESMQSKVADIESDWNRLFWMQHYDIPTRLLDWTKVLGVATFFAQAGEGSTPCIFLLNPYRLNSLVGINGCLELPDGSFHYEETYLNAPYSKKTQPMPQTPIAISPSISYREKNERLLVQKGTFTVHGKATTSLENQCEDSIGIIFLSEKAIAEIRDELRYWDKNQLNLFPDIYGLAVYVKSEASLIPSPNYKNECDQIFSYIDIKKEEDFEKLKDKWGNPKSNLTHTHTGCFKPTHKDFYNFKGADICRFGENAFVNRQDESKSLSDWLNERYSPLLDRWLEEEGMDDTSPFFCWLKDNGISSFKEWNGYGKKPPLPDSWLATNGIPPILFLTGTAGSGKTNLLLNLVFYEDVFHGKPVLFFPLKNLDSSTSLIKQLARECVKSKPSERTCDALSELIRDGKVVVLLDGLDELARTKGYSVVKSFAAGIWSIVNVSKSAKVIISCRDHILRRLLDEKVISKNRHFVNLSIGKLNEELVRKYLSAALPTAVSNKKELPDQLVEFARHPQFFKMVVESIDEFSEEHLPLRNKTELYEIWFRRIFKNRMISFETENVNIIAEIAADMLARRSNVITSDNIEQNINCRKIKKALDDLTGGPYSIFSQEDERTWAFAHQSLREYILAWSMHEEILSEQKGALSKTSAFDYEGYEPYSYLADLMPDDSFFMEHIISKVNVRTNETEWNNLTRNLFEAFGMLSTSNLTTIKNIINLACELLSKKEHNGIYINYLTKFNIVRCLERLHPSSEKPYYDFIPKHSWRNSNPSEDNFGAFAVRGFQRDILEISCFPPMVFKKDIKDADMDNDTENRVVETLLAILEKEIVEREVALHAEYLKINISFALIRWLPANFDGQRLLNLPNFDVLDQRIRYNLFRSLYRNISKNDILIYKKLLHNIDINIIKYTTDDFNEKIKNYF